MESTGGGRSTGCIVVAVLGCLGAVGALGVVVVAGALVFVSARSTPTVSPVPPTPPATAVSDEDPPPAPPDPSDASDPVSDDPDLTINVSNTPYTVRGESANDLRRQMDTFGPSDANGKHDAYTTWYVRWSYPFEREIGSCGLGRVKVTVDVKYTLPEWDKPENPSSDLVERWDRYMKALKTHEDGHRDNGVGAGREVLSKLRGVDEQSSCDHVEKQANDLGYAIVDRHRKRDASYDRDTRHGATQGARFP